MKSNSKHTKTYQTHIQLEDLMDKKPPETHREKSIEKFEPKRDSS